MKFSNLVPAIVVGAAASFLLSAAAVAAPDTPKVAAVQADKAATPAAVKADEGKADQKEAVKPAKTKTVKSKSRHFHPRDGK